MKLLQVNPYLTPLSGGPYISVSSLSRELTRKAVEVLVGGVSDVFTSVDASNWLPASVRTFRREFPRAYGYSAAFGGLFEAYCPDVVHTHGLWQYSHLAAYRYCRGHDLPLIVSPRGMLEPWAFRYKAWKKRPLWWLYERSSLQSARVLHATAAQEADGLRALGLTTPIAVIPNGVDLPHNCSPIPSVDGSRTALFLSRIHPKKGLLNLILAWNRVRPEGWRMVIAGPDEMGHEAQLREAVAQAGLEEVFQFAGAVFDERKSLLIRNAELFILPTFSENFGIAIAEALAGGVPVITTKGAPWRELEEFDCGWWVDIGVDPLAEALRKATSLGGSELRSMGMRGRQLVAERYSWETVADQMKTVYEWVLAGGRPPGCVATVA